MRYNQLFVSLLVVIQFGTTIIFCQEEPDVDVEAEDDSFLQIDTNNDKIITREEMTAYLSKVEGNDVPSDPEEVKKEHEKMIEEIFTTKDSDKDGLLSFEELLEDPSGAEAPEMDEEQQSELVKIDTDGDEKLSREEIIQYLMKEHSHSEDEGAGSEEDVKQNVEEFFKNQDKDNDGVISQEEFNLQHDEL